MPKTCPTCRGLGVLPDDDDAPTLKLPPFRERILPAIPPAVRELKGAELLRALADELAREADDLDDEQ